MSSPIPSSRAGWAVRHTLIVIALVTVFAVALHGWRTWGRTTGSSLPPTTQFHSDSWSSSSMTFSPTGDELFVASGEAVNAYDPSTGNQIRSWDTGYAWITQMSLNGDGSVAVTAGYQSSNNTMAGMVKTWDLSNDDQEPVELSQITKGGTLPSASALSPDGTQFALAWQPMGAAAGNTIHVYDTATGTETFACTGHTSTVAGLTFSPGGQTLVSVAWDSTIRQWDMASGQQSRSWPISSTGATIMSFNTGGNLLTYSADGKRFVVAGAGKGFEVRDTATGTVLASAAIQADNVSAIAYSPDGSLIAAAGNTYSGTPSFFGVFFGGNSEGTAGIWDAATGAPLVTLQQDGPGIQSLAFSPDGRWIAVGDENGLISIWDVAEVLEQGRRAE